MLVQYHRQIDVFVKTSQAENGGHLVYNGGPANLISAFPPHVEASHLIYNVLTEFIICVYTVRNQSLSDGAV